MKLHADVMAIRTVAPKGCDWLVCTYLGFYWWQDARGYGMFWGPTGFTTRANGRRHAKLANTAICLTTGSVHLQDESGTITEVPQSAWIAARRRRGRK